MGDECYVDSYDQENFRSAFNKTIAMKHSTIEIEDMSTVMSQDEIPQGWLDSGEVPTESEIQDMKNKLEEDGEDTIDFPTFLGLISRKMKGKREKHNEKKMRMAFRMFDEDGSGFISLDEFRIGLTLLGAGRNRDVTKEDLDKMIKEADIDGDGKINLAECILKLKESEFFIDFLNEYCVKDTKSFD